MKLLRRIIAVALVGAFAFGCDSKGTEQKPPEAKPPALQPEQPKSPDSQKHELPTRPLPPE